VRPRSGCMSSVLPRTSRRRRRGGAGSQCRPGDSRGGGLEVSAGAEAAEGAGLGVGAGPAVTQAAGGSGAGAPAEATAPHPAPRRRGRPPRAPSARRALLLGVQPGAPSPREAAPAGRTRAAEGRRGPLHLLGHHHCQLARALCQLECRTCGGSASQAAAHLAAYPLHRGGARRERGAPNPGQQQEGASGMPAGDTGSMGGVEAPGVGTWTSASRMLMRTQWGSGRPRTLCRVTRGRGSAAGGRALTAIAFPGCSSEYKELGRWAHCPCPGAVPEVQCCCFPWSVVPSEAI